MPEPTEILTAAFRRASNNLGQSIIDNEEVRERVEYVARNLKNRAGVRLLMACLLAKLHRPEVDVRKPYTEIGEPDAFSGRTYDERYLTAFINEHNLPCNNTTAFLTPALRNRSMMLTRTLNLLGKPPQLYQFVLELLDDVSNNRITPDDLLAETIRSHNAADVQTGTLGDVEITLLGDDEIITSYEMKNKRVTNEDIDRALQKMSASGKRVDNYIFITTEVIDEQVQNYARSLYQETGGIEFIVLDCISFIRHFLHLFHRLKGRFLETYQSMILEEPQSSVSQPVKEAFLAMWRTAEAEFEVD